MSPSKILVIEDNPKNLKLVRDVLTHSGYEVIEATSGEQGVRLAGEASPDLILMDLQMPGTPRRRCASRRAATRSTSWPPTTSSPTSSAG